MSTSTRFDWQDPVRLGLLGGVIVLSLAAIGMIESFAQRDVITGVITMGHVMLYGPIAVLGYMAAKKSGTANKGLVLASGALAGFIPALPLIGLIFLASAVNFRELGLVNISPALIDFLTFGLGNVAGSLVLAAVTSIAGLLGAIVDIIPQHIQRPLLIGLLGTLTVGLFSEVVLALVRNLFGQSVAKLFFSQKGIKPIPALVLFILITAFTAWWDRRGDSVKTRMAAVSPQRQKQMRWAAIGIGVVFLLLLPPLLGTYISEVLDMVGIYVLMGLGLNIVVGYAGLLDLGYVAFFAIGAYTMGVLTSQGEFGLAGLTFWSALPICVAAATLAGITLGIPVLRMRGDYLAIVTLGFGEIIRVLVQSDALRPLIGGAQGILLIPKPNLFGIQLVKPEAFYYLIVLGCLLAAFVAWRLSEARLGRQWMALREDEDVAEAMGINLVKTKLLAFAIGAAFSGLSGAIFANRLGSIFPHSFNIQVSINVLCLIIVGGMGSLPGVVVGALVLVGLPELLREFAEYRLMLYGILLIVMMLMRPEGLWPSAIRRRELHSYEDHEMPVAGSAAVEP